MGKSDILTLWYMKRPVRLTLRNRDSVVIRAIDDAKLLNDCTISIRRAEGYWTLVHRDAVVSIENIA